jgi:hypothetical protein
MKPVAYRFRFPRGGTPSLGVILHGRDPRTREIRRLPLPDIAVEWTVDWPSGQAVKTQNDVADPLVVDARSGAIFYPISTDHAADLGTALAPIPTRIRIIMPDGYSYPVLTGDIAMEG